MRLINMDLLLLEIERSKKENPHNDSRIRENHYIEHECITDLVRKQHIVCDTDEIIKWLEEFIKELCYKECFKEE